MRLTRGYLITLILLLLASLLGSTIAWRNISKDHIDAVRADRYRFSVGTLRSAADSGLKIGLDTASLLGMEALINEVRARQPDIISIDIFDAGGRITQSSDKASVGTTESLDWREACLAARGEIRLLREDENLIQCAALLNAYEQAVGGVALRYRSVRAPLLAELLNASRTDQATEGAWSHPALLSLLGLPLALLVLGAVLGRWAGQPLARELRQADQSLRSGQGSGDSALLGPMRGALETLKAREASARDIDAELERIDRIGTQ